MDDVELMSEKVGLKNEQDKRGRFHIHLLKLETAASSNTSKATFNSSLYDWNFILSFTYGAGWIISCTDNRAREMIKRMIRTFQKTIVHSQTPLSMQ
jgi:hypothetical protein